MSKEMLINVSEGEECRIAVLDDGKLEELYMERTSSTSHVGNIYKGKVTNVEASIQAAFVDFGLGRNGFLHISDLLPTYFGRKGDDYTEAVGRKMARRDRPPIQRCLRRGDEIVVQIIKEGIGTKGPTLSTYLSIPGRILVMMPGMSKFGISKKIEDEDERRRLRGILDSLKPIEDVGFIIRTAGIGKSKAEIERDLKYLTRLWDSINKKQKEAAPVELYTEGDLVTRTVRDVFTTDIDRIVVDSKDVAKLVKDFFKIAMPRTKNKVDLYEDSIPLFHKYNIEREIEEMYSRHVPLPSGGSLVIDSTEAIVAIDVNSGKFRDHSDAETTAFKTDMEAADEIPRQLRLRDLGGVIICDFIDLRFERHRRDLEQRLHDNLKKDRAKTKVLRMSQFGIIEMTRQRMRPSLKRSIYFDCPHCKGHGLVKTPESMSLDVMRRLAIAVHDQRVARVELSISPDVGFYLLNKKRRSLAALESESHKRILVKQDATIALDEMRLELFDGRDGQVYLTELGMSPHDHARPGQQRGEQRHGRREDRGRRRDQRLAQQRPTEGREEDDREEIADDAKLVEPPSEVIELDDAPEPMGEAPRGMDDDDRGRHRQGRRRERGRQGRDRGSEQRRHPPQQQSRPPRVQELPPPKVAPVEPLEDDDDAPGPGNEKHPSEQAQSDQTRKKRRRRGGRRIRERRERAAARAAEEAARGHGNQISQGSQSQEPDESEPLDEPPPLEEPVVEQRKRSSAQRTPPPARQPAPVVKTGSTDKHLVDDIPVDPEPPRRPRSRIDLDAVPDDFD